MHNESQTSAHSIRLWIWVDRSPAVGPRGCERAGHSCSGHVIRLGSAAARIPDLVAYQGLAVGSGTDSTGSNDSLDVLKEAYLAAVIHTWPVGSTPAHTCLTMATREGARALGR